MKRPLLSAMASLALLGGMQRANAQQGASLNFDGSNDVVNCGSALNATLDGLNTITVEAWVKPSTTSGLGVIVGNYNTVTNNAQMQFLLRRDGDTYTFWVDDGTGFRLVQSPASSVLLNAWQHVAGTWDGSQLNIYINGVPQGTTTAVTGASMNTTANDISIGGDVVNEMFSGNIDEVRIWGVSHSAAAISSYMNCTATDTSAGLLAAYSFNDAPANGVFNASYTTLHDVTGQGNDGTLNGFTLFGTSSNFVADAKSDYLGLQSSVGSLANVDRLYNGAAADFDNDGDNDMLVTDDNGATRLYINGGKGNFSNTYTGGIITPAIGFASYSTGDLDNDGDVDFVSTNQTSTVTAYINDGSGSFTPLATNLLNGTGAGSVSKIADVNNDGMMDIIVGNNTGNATDKTEVWLNTGSTGNAAFTFAVGLDNNSPKTSIAIGDVDGDNDMDIITGSYSYAAELFLNNSNNGTFTQGAIPSAYSDQSMLIDWDQDGDLDFMAYDRYGNVGLRVFYNDGTGNFAASGVTLLQSSSANTCELKDLNGDGFLDAVLSHFGGNGYVYLSNGCQLSLQLGCNYTLDYADNFVELADFNGDGSPDIFCGARNHLSTAWMNFLTPVTGTPLPTINISGNTLVNYGSSTVLTASGGVNYTWSANAGSATTASVSVNPVAATVYTVVGTNTVGCTSSTTVLVSLNGAALDFDGTDDVVDLGTNITTALANGTQITAEAWVYPTTTSGVGAIVGNHSGQFELRRNGNNYDFFIGAGTYAITSSATVTVNTWQHVAGVFDGNSISIYVNGVASGSTPVSSFAFPVSTTSVKIGADAFGENFSGTIDEVRIWNRALCLGEIQNNMNGELHTPQNGLMGYYMFDQGIANGNNAGITSAADSSGNGNNGTLNSFTLNGNTSNWIVPGGVLTANYASAYVVPTLTITGTTIICDGQSTTLTASGASTYTWTSGPSTSSYTVSPATNATYSVNGTTGAGCPVNMAAVTVTVNPSPAVSSQSGNVTACGDVSGTFTVNSAGNNTYQWYYVNTVSPFDGGVINGSYTEINYTTNSMTIQQLITGGYGGYAVYCVVTNTANCSVNSAPDTITANPLPAVTATATSLTLCLTDDDTLNASGAVNYTWSSNAGSATTASVVITPTTTTTDTYTVTGTDGNSCSNTATVTVTVINCSTGIDQNAKEKWTVYPNPSNGNFTLRSGSEIGTVEVYNTLGTLIYKTIASNTTVQIDLSNNVAGLYYLHAQGKIVTISIQ